MKQLYRFIQAVFLTLVVTSTTQVTAQQREQQITIKSEQITRLEAFELLEKQSGFSIAYEHSELDLKQPIKLLIENASLIQAMDAILQETTYTYKIKGYHIILISKEQASLEAASTTDQSDVYSMQSTEDTFTYSGIIIDQATKQPLSFATVILMNKKGQQLTAGITNEQGTFSLSTQDSPTWLSVSFIGYQTYTAPIPSRSTHLGTLHLDSHENVLDETIVTASHVEYKIDRNSYLVTDKMRERAANAEELLDQIHGVRFDKISNSIRVGTETAVLLLVDGIQQSEIYIRNLPPERIARIEVITEPSGKYLSDGYAAIINFLLKKDYNGYDIHARNFSMTSFAGYNGSDWLINEQPGIGITYTTDKLNIFADYVYANVHMNTPVWKSQVYEGQWDIRSEKTSKSNPNNQWDYLANVILMGLNYQLAPTHTLSFQGDYTFQNYSDTYLFKQEVKNLSTKKIESGISSNINKTRDKDYTGTLFYQGEIGDKLKLYSDFTYNYYTNNVENRYQQNNRFEQNNLYKEDKKYTKFNWEGEYLLNPQMGLTLGYVNVWRKYNSKTMEGLEMLDYSESRNQLYAYIQWKFNQRLEMKLGASVEHIAISSELKSNFWNIQPLLMLNYSLSKTANLNLSYQTNSYYPSLYQLSRLSTAIDSLMMQSGNPELKSAVRHNISAKVTLWDRLTFKSIFKFTPKRISEIYTHDNKSYYSTFANIDVKQYALQVDYDQPLGEYFSFSNSIMYYYDKASYKEVKSSYHGWIFSSEANYFNPRWKFGAQLGFYRSIDKGALLQGYQMVNLDSWMISAQKFFWGNRGSLMVTYFPPLRWGVRSELKKEIKTPFYNESYSQSLSPYRNMLMVRVGLRFNSGKTRSVNKQSSVEREERAKRAVGF